MAFVANPSKMIEFKQPIAVYFVWHPDDASIVKPLVNFCYERFQRDTSKPFSRSMNLPVFFRTSVIDEIPSAIESKSEKTLVFCFSSKSITGRKKWRDYYKTFFTSPYHIVPVAIEQCGFNIGGKFERLNFVRLMDFDKKYFDISFFISVTHEIIRFAFMKGGTTSGDISALKLFLSHTKYDSWAVNTAVSLKRFIDETSIHRFFDVHDIHAAHDFGTEIDDGIKNSTLIAIQSDSYSNRYWCQKEIQFAKESNKPMVVVNHLKKSEDRIFPHCVNVPSVRVQSNSEISDGEKYRVITIALLETLRHHYHTQFLENYNSDSVLILNRPPELTDIPLLIKNSGGKIDKNFNAILYPEPPVYENELKFLVPFGIKAETPLSHYAPLLKGSTIGISVSEPDKKEISKIGQSESHLINLSQTIARHLLFRRATLVYGGDLRLRNNFTEYLCEEALIVKDCIKEFGPLLKNFSAWPIYNITNDRVIEWNSQNHQIAEMIEVDPPSKVRSGYNTDKFLPPDSPLNLFAWSLSLTKMRNEMIDKCDYRICAGGRLFGYKGKYPGVLEEILISIKLKKPLYLIGGFGGITSRVCDFIIGGNIAEELTYDWQVDHTLSYSKLSELFYKDPSESNIDYSGVLGEIATLGLEGLSRGNGLTVDQNKRLFKSEFIDEVVMLIVKGIDNLTHGY